MLAKLQGLLGLTRPDAMTLDLLLLQPLVGLPVLVIVLAQSDYAFSKVKATVALFAGHLVAYGARHYMDALLSGQYGFPSQDERRLIILYGYLGWCIGPLAATSLLLMLSRPGAVAPLTRHPSSPERRLNARSGSASAAQWASIGAYILMGASAMYVLTDDLLFFMLTGFAGLVVFGGLVVGALWRAADRAEKHLS